MLLRHKVMNAAIAIASVSFNAPAAAELTRVTENSFVSRHEVVVAADPKEVWLTLITPAEWWRAEHTWSGDAANLTLTPQAGGCFCETIPEVDEPGRVTLQGSVEHMRVVQAYPEQALRMQGALGPLQSEPVTGVLTVAISKVEQGTRIVWEYNVGGPMRYEVPVISKAVDGVMAAQIAALAKPLKVVAVPVPPAVPAAPQQKAPAASSAVAAPVKSTPPPAARGAAALPKAKAPPQPAAEAGPPPKPTTVKDAFGDLYGPAPR